MYIFFFFFPTNEVEEHFGPLILIRHANGPVALLLMEKKIQEDTNSTGSLGH